MSAPLHFYKISVSVVESVFSSRQFFPGYWTSNLFRISYALSPKTVAHSGNVLDWDISSSQRYFTWSAVESWVPLYVLMINTALCNPLLCILGRAAQKTHSCCSSVLDFAHHMLPALWYQFLYCRSRQQFRTEDCYEDRGTCVIQLHILLMFLEI